METLKTCPACKDVTIEEVEHSEADEVREYCRECIEDLLGPELPEQIEGMIQHYEERLQWEQNLINLLQDLHKAYMEMFIQQALMREGKHNTFQRAKRKHEELEKAYDAATITLSETPDPSNLDYFVHRAKQEHENVKGRDELHMNKLLKSDKK
jgi:hypothetical protein